MFYFSSRASDAWHICLLLSLRFPTLEHCSTGGESLLPEEFKQWKERTDIFIHELYGQSEMVGEQATSVPFGWAQLQSTGNGLLMTHCVLGSSVCIARLQVNGELWGSRICYPKLAEEKMYSSSTYWDSNGLKVVGWNLKRHFSAVPGIVSSGNHMGKRGCWKQCSLLQFGDHQQILPIPPSYPRSTTQRGGWELAFKVHVWVLRRTMQVTLWDCRLGIKDFLYIPHAHRHAFLSTYTCTLLMISQSVTELEDGHVIYNVMHLVNLKDFISLSFQHICH